MLNIKIILSLKKFVDKLEPKIKNEMIIKLHPRFHYKIFDEELDGQNLIQN